MKGNGASGRGPRRIGRWIRDAILILGISALLGLALEAVTRVVGRMTGSSWPTTRAVAFDREIRQALRLYRRHPFLNTAPHEGAVVTAFGKTARLSSAGYRSPDRPRDKPAGVVRILCAGGSTTFDILAPDNAATWPSRLEAELRDERPGIEVINAGFPGWTSLENLISLAIRDVDRSPDVVVLYQGINDLQPAAHRPYDPQYEHGHAELAVRALGFELAPPTWYERSLLVEKGRDLVFGPDNPWRMLQAPSPTTEPLSRIPSVAVATFERNVRSFVAAAEAHGAMVALATQPVRIRSQSRSQDLEYLARWIEGLDPEAVPDQLDRLNDVLRRLGDELHVAVLDVAGDVAWDDGDLDDPMHFSVQGSERMGRYMASVLAPLLDGAPSEPTTLD